MLPELQANPPLGVSFAHHTAHYVQTISVLGSTGSIGTQTLEIARIFPDEIKVAALSAGSNWTMLAHQANEFRPEAVCIYDRQYLDDLRRAISSPKVRVLAGAEGLSEIAVLSDVDTVVAAIVGSAGLEPVLAAAGCGKRIALANKESLVVAGALVTSVGDAAGSALVPVDSEHSAIFQCLVGEAGRTAETIILTASGGPFRNRSAASFGDITLEEALDHPNWDMGPKITIDSATLMNKGLEVIEAHWLFRKEVSDIEVVIHPESIVHSMVTFCDGSSKAQLGVPDMKVPIQYALSYPERWPAPHPRVDWHTVGSLRFEAPDLEKFPCLALAFDAVRSGGSAPCVLNAANEVAVDGFLSNRICFNDIPRLVGFALSKVGGQKVTSLEGIREVDTVTRYLVNEELNRISR